MKSKQGVVSLKPGRKMQRIYKNKMEMKSDDAGLESSTLLIERMGLLHPLLHKGASLLTFHQVSCTMEALIVFSLIPT
ncbi:hypothetical protein MACJ_003774 [Theileria orientalis]|uniref:Uncharacterized protein n=1 Tax=Theileria orientalis TaxID=68886 RepID=A0A976SKK6_THEOR|nr:hypothetical protein MACJ_003774 [Theileria orientalis]